MRKTLLLLFVTCLAAISQAQQKLPSLDYRPQSPVTAAFTRYGDIPVDLSTGVPSISVPIYTLNAPGINVPISISYHASGIKVSDVASAVGLGWTLNAGGVISRSVFGQPDEYLDIITASGQGQTIRPPWKNKQEFMQSWYAAETTQESIDTWNANLYEFYLGQKNTYDYYSDRFYYSLGNGESGVFRKDFTNNEIKLIPYRPIKTRFYWTGVRPEDLKIEMITADGTLYDFKRNKYDLWHLEKIVNSAKTDSVIYYSHYEEISNFSLNETQPFGVYKMAITQRTEAYIKEGTFPYPECLRTLELRDDYATGIVTNPVNSFDEIVLIDSVVSSNAVVKFVYAQDRQDYQNPTLPNASPHARLTKVQVFSKLTGVLVKNVNFSHSYNYDGSNDLSKRLMLDGVQVGANAEEKYVFRYNADHMPAYVLSNANGLPYFQEDLWGYKNKEGSATLLLSDFAPYGASNLFPDEEKAKACIIEEVKYPTGGKTIFEFESNRLNFDPYLYGFTSPKVPRDGLVGGLRIKKISNYAYDEATPEIKQYEYYTNLNSAYGALWWEQFVYTQEVFNTYDVLHCPGTPLGFSMTKVSSSNYAVPKPLCRYIGGPQAPIIYDHVTEYIGNPTTNLGKTVYRYELPSTADLYDGDPRFAGPWPQDRGNYTPHLYLKEEYKNDNGQYKKVRRTESYSTVIQNNTFSTGFNLGSDLQFFSFNSVFDIQAFNTYNFGLHNSFFNTLHYSDNVGYTALLVPGEITVYDYIDNNNYLKTKTEYSYNQYGQQIAANTTTSKGELLKTKFTYPVDYPGLAPYNTMIERNNISPIVEQATYKNTFDPGNLLSSIKTNYNYWDYASQAWGSGVSNQILPQKVETQKGANDVETRIQYFSYDEKGNPVYVGKENDTRQLYLWDYNKTYPVAQVMNVAESDKRYVVYNSFEAVTSWPSSQGIIVDDNTAPTGKKCLSLLGVNSLQYALNSNKSYILSYWYKAGSSISVAANSDILANPPAKNGWVFMKRKIAGSSSISISGSGYIDELRLYPETAQMVTFAYEPLVGITAQCDINDKIIYYSYDASGRLSLVKDDNGNILKKICYNFQGQPDACGENALPLWQLTGVTRCKPCPQNSNYITNIQQREEKDNNPNSDTYGNVRWVDGEFSMACVVSPDWQNTVNTRCVTVNNQNTGEQQREQSDVNPCSGSLGQKRWVSAGTNTTACPLPPAFRSIAINKNYFKQNCGSQQIPLPYPVNLPEGAYTSANSPAEANALAEQEAQRRANEFGGCTTVYIKMVAVVEPSGPNSETTNFHFKFYSDAAGTNPLVLPSWFYINYREHTYWTDWDMYYDEAGTNDLTLVANDGTNESVVTYVQTRDCTSSIENYCRYTDWLLLPGRYVIIP